MEAQPKTQSKKGARRSPRRSPRLQFRTSRIVLATGANARKASRSYVRKLYTGFVERVASAIGRSMARAKRSRMVGLADVASALTSVFPTTPVSAKPTDYSHHRMILRAFHDLKKARAPRVRKPKQAPPTEDAMQTEEATA